MTNNSINTDGQVIQFIYSNTATVFTLTTVIATDDTIPQNTEGHEILTVTITPKYTTSTLVIEYNCAVTGSFGNNTINCALFQDTTAGALAAVNMRPVVANTGSNGAPLNLVYSMTSGTTSATTFKIRCGPSVGTNYINANDAGTRLMGGVSYATISVTEYY